MYRTVTVAALCGVLAVAAGPSVALAAPDTPAASAAPTAAEREAMAKADALLKSLTPRRGEIAIPEAGAKLKLSDRYYFLGAADAKRVLTEGWGNRPEDVDGVLGMVFPAGVSPLDDTWGAVVTWVADGHVSDADAAEIDYAALLKDMQSGEDEENKARKEAGFEPVHMVGWAEAPRYDKASHTLIWAKDLKYGGQTDHTLNYDVRVLGRRGVLSLNVVASMSDLEAVRQAAAGIQQTAAFDAGARYADFKPGEDKQAAYGLAGLVAGVGAGAAAKKLGLLAVVAAFGKKFIGVIVVALGGLVAAVRNLLGRKK